MKRKYRIRKLSPLWWMTRIFAVAISIVGAYAWLLIMTMAATTI